MGRFMRFIFGVLALLAINSIPMRGLTATSVIDPAKLTDLTYSFDSTTIYWPTEHPFVHQFEHYGMIPEGYLGSP
jgi:hypothetical protein